MNILRDIKFFEGGTIVVEAINYCSYTNFKGLTLRELLICAAETKLVLKSSKLKQLDGQESFLMISKLKQLTDKTASNITDTADIYQLICLVFNQLESKDPIVSLEVIDQKFEVIVKKLDELDVSQLGKLTVISYTLCERHFETFKKALVAQFEQHQDFRALGFNSIMWIWRGLVVKYPIWPKNIQTYFKAVYNHLLSVNGASAKLSYLSIMNEDIEYCEYPITQTLMYKLISIIKKDANYFGIVEKQSIPYFTFQVLCSLNNEEIAMTAGIELSNRFFINYFLKNTVKRISKLNKKRIFRSYLMVCESFKIYQQVYFDIMAYNLDIIFTDPTSKLLFTFLMPSFYCLTFLNYEENFKYRVYNRRLKNSWESIKKKLHNAIISGQFSNFLEIDEDIELQKHDRKIILLNYLWSLAYLDNYNLQEIKILVESERFSNVKPEDLNDFLKLFQINHWLTKKAPNGPKIIGMNQLKMNTFKEIFDKTDAKPMITPVHTCISHEIQKRQNGFIPNYKNFPLFFDFVNIEKKIGIIINKEETMVKNGSILTYDGVQIMSDRIANDLGWKVKRLVSYKSKNAEDLNLDYSHLFD